VRKNLEVQLASDVPLIAEAFQRAGYRTGAFVSSYVLLGHFGLGRGFETYDASFYDLTKPDMSTERTAQDTLAVAQAWITKQTAPWFCWIHLYDPHSPYAPPSPYNAKYKSQPYDGELAYMDASLGEFFASHAGLLNKTIVIICGDHGESLGEHGEAEHGVFLYDATTRVPLLVRLPGAPASRRVAQDVGLVDVAPTLRELCGLPAASTDGFSLVPLLNGRPLKRQPVLIESLIPLLDYGWAPLYAAVDGNRKFILAPRPEFYDLDKDPAELAEVKGSFPRDASRLEKVLKNYVAEVKPASTQKRGLGDEEMRSLQSLGYISGGGAPASRKIYRDPKDCKAILKDVYDSVALKKAGHVDEAARLLEEALRLDPGNATVAVLLGQCYEGHDTAKAEAAYRKAIHIRPDYPQPYIRLVALLLESGRSQESYDAARVALQHTQDYSGMLNTLMAWAAFRCGKPQQEVLALLDEARKVAPERPLSYKLRAVLCLKNGDPEGAIGFLGRMASCAPPFLMKALENEEEFKPLRQDQRFWRLVMGVQGHEGTP
jgi:arylsulfatase A-like enzyme